MLPWIAEQSALIFWTRLLHDWESVFASRVKTIQFNSKFFFLRSHAGQSRRACAMEPGGLRLSLSCASSQLCCENTDLPLAFAEKCRVLSPGAGIQPTQWAWSGQSQLPSVKLCSRSGAFLLIHPRGYVPCRIPLLRANWLPLATLTPLPCSFLLIVLRFLGAEL